MKPNAVAPGLLISMPQLSDPTFARAVVLMLDHSEEGSFGLILNQKSTMSVQDLVSQIDAQWAGASRACVFNGGPVMPGSAWVVHSGCPHLGEASSTIDDALERTGHMKIDEGLYVTMNEDNIRILAHHPPAEVRFFLGYAGWGAGQLTEEMIQSAWLHTEATSSLIFDSTPKQLWNRSLQSMGVAPSHLTASRGLH